MFLVGISSFFYRSRAHFILFFLVSSVRKGVETSLLERFFFPQKQQAATTTTTTEKKKKKPHTLLENIHLASLPRFLLLPPSPLFLRIQLLYRPRQT